MKQELEIEYKNLLTKDEYNHLLTTEFTTHSSVHKITQTNHYFDTKDQLLKKHYAAVRIRISEKQNELTFKVPAQGFLMESNFSLNESQTNALLNKKKFSLNEITDQKIDLNIPGLTEQSIFEHFNQFKTIRYEKKMDDHLMVLDQTTFQNNAIDYELEVESNDSLKGKIFFDSLLEQYLIPSRPTLPKIARAENNR